MNNILDKDGLTQDTAIAYNSRRLAKFDPTFGDGGCQGRALIILPMVQAFPKFADLPSVKQEFLKLCYVLQPNREDMLDEIGIIVDEQSGEIPELNECSKKVAGKIRKDMLKQLSKLTIDLVTEQAQASSLSTLGLGAILNHRDILTASTSVEAMMALQICEAQNIPILLKLRRMEYMPLTNTFMCGFVELLQLNYTGTKIAGVKTPALVIEGYSLKSEVGANLLTPEMAELNSANGFDEYIDRLNTFGLFKAIELDAILYDVGRKFTLPIENDGNPMNFNHDYVAYKTLIRQTACTPFAVQHFYASTVEVELADVMKRIGLEGKEFKTECNTSRRVV
ncbi:MAG: hypothetical protein ACHP6I_03075 [Rickettsiales bacterium]